MSMLMATCRDCRAWYCMDFEEGVDNQHWDMNTGLLCTNNDDDRWTIVEVDDREEWNIVN